MSIDLTTEGAKIEQFLRLHLHNTHANELRTIDHLNCQEIQLNIESLPPWIQAILWKQIRQTLALYLDHIRTTQAGIKQEFKFRQLQADREAQQPRRLRVASYNPNAQDV